MPAVSRFGGLAFLTIVACWTSPATPPAQTPGPALEVAKHDLSGHYWCSIDDYPRYACVIAKVGEDMVLAKLSGSQRIRGRITMSGAGFRFVGELYCPYGDCKQELHGNFTPATRGGFQGKFNEDEMIVHLTPAAANAFGGDGYGGAEYGGALDADGSYGGAGYGRRNYRIDIRGRRRP
jgi:hypothetical protein